MAVYSHIDRMVTVGCMPVHEIVPIDKGLDIWKTFGTHFFLERREIGIFNIGGNGAVTADGTRYEMGFKDCLYLSRGTKDVSFSSDDPAQPAKFYMVSAPAHKACPSMLIPIAKANQVHTGAKETCNERTIYQFIHPNVLETCQLCMGLTALNEGSVWNTMPAHTHERRMEVYTYIDMTDNDVVFHMMGEPTQTRHVVLRKEQAIISPSWSIHSGCGTSNYTLIWAMGGENIEFTDMDTIKITDLR